MQKKKKPDAQKSQQEPIPFDEALRRLVNTPPERKKKPSKDKDADDKE